MCEVRSQLLALVEEKEPPESCERIEGDGVSSEQLIDLS